MSGSALEGGAVFESEHQAAIRIGRSIVQQAAPELFVESGDLCPEDCFPATMRDESLLRIRTSRKPFPVHKA